MGTVKLAVLFLMLQLTMFDCFPASVYMSLKNMGARITYQEVLDLAVTGDVGYYADPSFVSEFGFDGGFSYISEYDMLIREIESELVENDYPIMCKNMPNRLGHCVTVYGLDETLLYVLDPQVGYDVIELSKMYDFRYDLGWFLVVFEAPNTAQIAQNWGK